MQDREREGWDDRTVPPRVVELQRERERRLSLLKS